jgi:hypothetical protein
VTGRIVSAQATSARLPCVAGASFVVTSLDQLDIAAVADGTLPPGPNGADPDA